MAAESTSGMLISTGDNSRDGGDGGRVVNSGSMSSNHVITGGMAGATGGATGGMTGGAAGVTGGTTGGMIGGMTGGGTMGAVLGAGGMGGMIDGGGGEPPPPLGGLACLFMRFPMVWYGVTLLLI